MVRASRGLNYFASIPQFASHYPMRMLIICPYSSIRARHKSNSFALWYPQKFNFVEKQHWCSKSHPIVFTLPLAGTHGIHPQVGVHLIGAHSRVWVNELWHSHRPDARVQSQKAEVSDEKPNPSRIQHPPHVQCKVSRRDGGKLDWAKRKKVPPSFVGPMCDYSNRWRVKVGLQSAGGRLASPKCWRSEDVDALHHI